MSGLGFAERYESKYLIDGRTRDAIRAAIAGICAPDPFTSESPGGVGYEVHSLYFDTPGLRFYHARRHREPERFKPRVRTYGDLGEGDVAFAEVKRKSNGVVRKTRRKVPLAQWAAFLEGGEPAAPSGAHGDVGFLDAVRWTGAVPVVHVRYRREAWVGVLDPYARVTFDTHLRAAPARGSIEASVPEAALTFFDNPWACGTEGSPVVLELKSEVLVPAWMTRLVRRFGLPLSSFSKYCQAIDHIAERDGVSGRRRAVFR